MKPVAVSHRESKMDLQFTFEIFLYKEKWKKKVREIKVKSINKIESNIEIETLWKMNVKFTNYKKKKKWKKCVYNLFRPIIYLDRYQGKIRELIERNWIVHVCDRSTLSVFIYFVGKSFEPEALVRTESIRAIKGTAKLGQCTPWEGPAGGLNTAETFPPLTDWKINTFSRLR